MEEMKQRFANAVAGRLAAAPDSNAKTELVEELSGNLYRRYLDMAASGMTEAEAFDRALDELGDTAELVDYLKGLSPDEDLPELTLHPDEEQGKSDWPGKDELNDLIDSVSDVVQSAMDKAGDALRKAKATLEQTGRTGTWRSGDGSIELHFDNSGRGPGGRQGEDGPNARWDERGPDSAGGFSYSAAGSVNVMFGSGSYTVDDGAQPLRGVDIQTVNGDVTIRLLDAADAPIRVEGDVEQLEVKVTENGVLAIRQGRTASSSFFFLRGLTSADVELYMPRRRWEFLQVSAVNGDVDLDGGFELDRLSVKTASGDLRADLADCGQLYFKSASGDLDCRGVNGMVQVETMSGGVRLAGSLSQARLSSISGDVEVEGTVQDVRLSSVSGDVRLETAILPERMELSSKSGDCEARIPASGPFTLRFKTTSGEFDSDFPLQRTSHGAIYDGGGGPVYAMTSVSGDLELRRY